MPFQFQSWEFLFGANLALVLVYPFLAHIFKNEKALNSILFFFPAAAATTEHLLIKADLDFHLKLCILHWGVSLLAIYGLWKFLPEKRKHLLYFSIVFVSLVFSFSKFLISPSLVWLDPFWGVVPGTVSIDPIISLDPYLYRLAILFIVSMTLLSFQSAVWFVTSFWALAFLLGAVPSSPFLSSRSLVQSFKSKENFKQLELYFEGNQSSIFSPWVWSRELGFALDRMLAKLPEKNSLTSKTPYRIFFYASDDSKANWIGARQTEIGHFLHGEMHLSHLVPGQSVLAHELAHLIHGKIEAPLISYLDPFYLEGFAVAISTEDENLLLDEASALVQTLDLKDWPRGSDFFFLYSPDVAYTLAGAAALKKIQQKEWPWQGEPIDLSIFKSRKVTPEQLFNAKKALERKAIFKDPLVRDCTRLEWSYALSKTNENLTKLEDVCPNWKTSPHYRTPPSDEHLLVRSFEQIENTNLRAAKSKFYLGITKNDPKNLARDILANWKTPISASGEAFKKRLQWEVEN